ncbi:c-type cytochrome [Castellaniella sp. S9]|uniref:c-type cytochrome n=1 Tax=Castellaniella sp. S9 TaxID=2993652 RepID=UPI0022B4D1C3|nr:c-type cytochrome [Castellaniella sp. S9]
MFKTLGIAALALALAPFASMAADGGKVNPSGEKLYKSSCVACHSTGAANAPKLGNKKAWEPIIARGMDEMMAVAINGRGAMPARGGTKADDAALRAAVEYMVSRVR